MNAITTSDATTSVRLQLNRDSTRCSSVVVAKVSPSSQAGSPVLRQPR